MKQYQKIFQEMLAQNEALFAKFREVHDRFAQDPQNTKVEFNKLGSEVMDVIRRYERKLVGSTERSQYSKFSSKLSDKFWEGVRMLFPKIDFVGIK